MIELDLDDRLRAVRHWLGTWPAAEVVETSGWLLQATEGFTKRANAALRLAPDAPIDPVIEFYTARGLRPSVVDYAGLADPLPAELLGDGWHALAFDPVLAMPITGLRLPEFRGTVEVQLHGQTPPERWLAGWFASGRQDSAVSRALVTGSAWQAFALIDDPDASPANELPVAVGRIAVDGGWAGVNAMWTRPDQRGRGYAGMVLQALAGAAQQIGAGCLQLSVEHDNHAARAAYAKAGFGQVDRYRYLFAPADGRERSGHQG